MPSTSPPPADPDRPTAGSWSGGDVTCRRYGWLVGVAVLTAVLTVGCGAPPEARDSGGLPTRAATTTPSSPASPATPSFGALPSAGPTLPSADPGLVAVACTGEPSAKQIVELVRGRRGLLPGNARVSVRTGPLCAAGWQLTTLDVAGYEPLQVVTRDRAGTLRLVTAGTDVCTAEVRVASPAGIQTLACGSDGGGVPVPVPTPSTVSPTPSPSPSGSSPTPGA
ncbi:hypothetical protein [Micromonospora andamanensis]|uniref:hypothetical protein n=1 Tax=Micromonospora andamanensis TaxID=1287068 RepID=UPI001A3F94F2|nr:hypothetical protein Vwe01_56560 [Micromonospora andamanensis]